jgi:hypothetical protein
MRNFYQTAFCLLSLCIFKVQCALAEENHVEGSPFKASATVQSGWDSNFSRSPQNDAEQIILSSAALGFDNTFGRQRLIAKWRGSHYQYEQHPDFDASTNSAQLAWKGLIGSQINTDVEWLRDSYLVDRLEFFGKDIVDRDDFQAKIGYGNDRRLSFHAGGRKSTQRHSNETRVSLDFDEEEAFVDVGYQTNNKSSVFIRFKSGDRTYLNPPSFNPAPLNSPVDIETQSLDFDYDQIELEGILALSPKTTISGMIASFERKGIINEASGSLATLSVDWQATDKTTFNAGYTYRQPAIGETSDSPSQVQNIFASVAWQYTTKISVGSVVRYSWVDYEYASPDLVRREYLYNFSPLTISYDSGRHWLVRVDSGWRKNESPLAYRNYISRQVMLGFSFIY